MLTIDRIGREVLLFAPDGVLIRKLTIEACLPGTELVPMDAHFYRSGLVVSIVQAPFFVRFSHKGDCQGRMYSDRVPQAMHWTTDDSGNLITLDRTKENVAIHDAKGDVEKTFVVRHSRYPNLERRWMSTTLRWVDGDVFVSGLMADTLSILDTGTGHVSKLSLSFPGLPKYRGPDAPENGAEFLRQMRKIMSGVAAI
ncbi:MAG: hypothetical protein KDD65_15765, partial [Bacteroidetes bacterium]|nr:hypothetical protein [Bacteroidota bacterium]